MFPHLSHTPDIILLPSFQLHKENISNQMEAAAGGASESIWSSYSSTTVPTEDPEIMALLFGSTDFPEETPKDQSLEMASMYWNDQEIAASHYKNSTDANAGFVYWSQSCDGNSSNSHLPPNPNDVEENYYLSNSSAAELSNQGPVPMDFFMAEEKGNASSPLPGPENFLEVSCFETGNEPEPASPPHRKSTPKRGLTAMSELERSSSSSSSKITTIKKKSRVSTTPDNVRGKSKRGEKNIKNPSALEDCNDSTTVSKQSSDCFSSEEDSSSAQDINDGEAYSGKKKGGSSSRTRAGRGSATDPQSLYARKRRERINERLKILQNLVPNGTKVDISTMLEEAVRYVKFLQIKIKLLSCNDLWMYAPIAYNGMDIGLDLKISPPE